MDVRSLFSVLFHDVKRPLGRVDLPSKQRYLMFQEFLVSLLLLASNRTVS